MYCALCTFPDVSIPPDAQSQFPAPALGCFTTGGTSFQTRKKTLPSPAHHKTRLTPFVVRQKNSTSKRRLPKAVRFSCFFSIFTLLHSVRTADSIETKFCIITPFSAKPNPDGANNSRTPETANNQFPKIQYHPPPSNCQVFLSVFCHFSLLNFFIAGYRRGVALCVLSFAAFVAISCCKIEMRCPAFSLLSLFAFETRILR